MKVKKLMEILKTVDEEAIVVVSDKPGRGCACSGYILGVTDETFKEEVLDEKALKERIETIKERQEKGLKLFKMDENFLNGKTLKAIELYAYC